MPFVFDIGRHCQTSVFGHKDIIPSSASVPVSLLYPGFRLVAMSMESPSAKRIIQVEIQIMEGPGNTGVLVIVAPAENLRIEQGNHLILGQGFALT